MRCADVRPHLIEYQRGQLPPEGEDGVRAHLAECPSCSGAEEAERTITGLLERRLPQHPAPIRLKRSLASTWPVPAAARRSRWGRWGRTFLPAGAAALVVLLAVSLIFQSAATRRAAATGGMVREAVNDHLRLLQSGQPLDVVSGNFHQVKPWFAGRLDFAPSVPFLGDEEFPLRGGSLAYFLDRRAALFVYNHRLHVVSVFVFRAEGLPWPDRNMETLGKARVYVTTARGFNVILWRAGELGYAVVSDADPAELRRLAGKLSGEA